MSPRCWSLLAGVALAFVGHAAWSHVDSHHVVRTEVRSCPQVGIRVEPATHSRNAAQGQVVMASSDACPGTEPIVLASYTTPNRVPSLALGALGGLFVLAGVALLRRTDPERHVGAAA